MLHKLGAAFLLLLCASCSSSESEDPTEGNAVGPAQPPAMPATDPAEQPLGLNSVQPALASTLMLDDEGLRVVDTRTGTTRLLPFGSPKERTSEVLGKLLGKITSEGSNDECGAGRLSFTDYDSLTTWFQEDEFVGWESQGKLTTADSVGVGSSRTALEQSRAIELPESTIGVEFAAGGISGLFNSKRPDAKVTDIWAGVTCIFR